LVEDGKFGSVDESGRWDGLVGELVIGRAEMAIGPISSLWNFFKNCFNTEKFS